MPVVTTAAILDAAIAENRAALAFNVVTLEQAEGVLLGAEEVGAPVILQISENAVLFHAGDPAPLAAACLAAAASSNAEASLHFDHVTDLDLVAMAPDLGFSSVMIDASQHDDATNVRVTASVARQMQGKGLHVEAELGEIGGKDGAHAPGVRTDPGDAAMFVRETGVDALAVAVGSSHAMSSRTASLDHDLIRRIKDELEVPLVLHGSSGVPPEELRAAVAAGMTKINIGTLLGRAYSDAIRAYLDGHDNVKDPRKFLSEARAAVAAAVAQSLRDVDY
ncbi:MAG: class II fructose-bisphosphate aldolase [Actinomycetia bacterium]|nr:class II fructose-bisphosphate aldolase [Actinomycetes bacterium]